MDPLSDVLSLLKPRSYLFGGLDAGGEWAIRFPEDEGVKCYALVSGACWLSVDGVAAAVQLAAGDCFLLPRGREFRLGSDLVTAGADAYEVFADGGDGRIITYNGGGGLFGVGGHFDLAGDYADMLLEMLPPIVHIRKEADKAALRWSVERMIQELREPQPGSFLVAQQMAYMMLVQALRIHLAEGFASGTGWLFALADKQLNAAITAMHEDPAHGWTLQELAQRAGMSRSIFALRFKKSAGSSAMEYLTRWRMTLAGDRLKNSKDAVAAIALSVGYESESAFSKAFRKVMGCSPRQYGRGGKNFGSGGRH